jgi:hypothetical protein
MFDEILRRELKSMLSRVAEGEGLDINYLVNTYFPPDLNPTPVNEKKAEPKKRSAKVTVTAIKCTAKTAKGKPCSLGAVEGGCLCRVHLKSGEKPEKEKEKKPEKEKTEKKKKPAKKKKTDQPTHTHELDDKEHDDCDLCQTHGTPLAETDDEEEFETVVSPPRTLRERLSRIATEEYEDEEEDE